MTWNREHQLEIVEKDHEVKVLIAMDQISFLRDHYCHDYGPQNRITHSRQ